MFTLTQCRIASPNCTRCAAEIQQGM